MCTPTLSANDSYIQVLRTRQFERQGTSSNTRGSANSFCQERRGGSISKVFEWQRSKRMLRGANQQNDKEACSTYDRCEHELPNTACASRGMTQQPTDNPPLKQTRPAARNPSPPSERNGKGLVQLRQDERAGDAGDPHADDIHGHLTRKPRQDKDKTGRGWHETKYNHHERYR